MPAWELLHDCADINQTAREVRANSCGAQGLASLAQALLTDHKVASDAANEFVKLRSVCLDAQVAFKRHALLADRFSATASAAAMLDRIGGVDHPHLP